MSHEFFYLNFTHIHFVCKIIDNFLQYGTFQDLSYNASGPSYTVVTEKSENEVEKYFSENPNSTCSSTRNFEIFATQNCKNFFEIKSVYHQLLTTKSMEAPEKFCKTITEMFGSGEIDENNFFFRRGSFLVKWICQ